MKQLIDWCLTALEAKLNSFQERIGNSYYLMSDDMDALANRMNALQQEMDTIQRKFDFQKKASQSIDTKTHTSIDNQQETTEIRHASIDINIATLMDDKHPAPYVSVRDEIFNSIKMDNQ
ncbi:hypothetical protein Rs2_28561 [Raphanus sativus]|nr:hypothetical protein Rs2_28561 [Raphanus sativus]